jgi:phenylacetate-CoA ligase
MFAGSGKEEVAGDDVRVLLAERLAAGRRRDGLYGSCPGGALASWPILTGEAFAAEVEAHPPFGRIRLDDEPLLRAGLVTTAVPRPVPIAWSRADLGREAALGARFLRGAGLRARSRTSDTLGGGLVTPGTLAVSDALDALDAVALPVGPINGDVALARAREIWEIVRPEALIVDAPTLAFLEGAGQTAVAPSLVVVLTPGEAESLAVSSVETRYRVLSVPQVGTFVAGECARHAGLHFAEDAFVAETVDEAGMPSEDGAAGRLLLTPLRRSLALIRFDTGLRARIDRTPCECGGTDARLHVEG